MSLRLVSSDDEPTYAVHRNQFAARSSGLNIGYFDDSPWFTRRIWRWTAIAVMVLSLVGLGIIY